MRSRQLSGSSRFDRDHLIDSERRERRECHGADRGTHVPSWQRSPCRASREGQSRGCHLALSQPARPLVRGWPPIEPCTVNGRSRHPWAAPTRAKLVAFDRWRFPSDLLRAPRRGTVHRSSAAPNLRIAASMHEQKRCAGRLNSRLTTVGLHRGFMLFLISMAAVALALGGMLARPVAPFRRRELS